MHSSILKILFCLIGCLFSTVTFSSSSKILILGDSLSAAYNISIEQSWPVLFEKKLKTIDGHIQVINASISGETTHGGLQRLEGLVAKHRPDYLILELGGNDGLRGYQFKQTQQALRQMITFAEQHKIGVLLIGVRLPPNLGPVYNQRFQRIYQSLANESRVVYLPRFLEGIAASTPDYMQADGIHPTETAQPLLADKVFRIFRSNFLQ